MPDANVRETTIGAHSVRFTAPNLFRIIFEGDVSADDLAKLGGLFAEAKTKIYLLVDATRLGSVSADSKLIRSIPISAGSAVWGASFKARTALSIFNKVYMMVNLGEEVPLAFFDSEAPAATWLDKIRGV